MKFVNNSLVLTCELHYRFFFLSYSKSTLFEVLKLAVKSPTHASSLVLSICKWNLTCNMHMKMKLPQQN